MDIPVLAIVIGLVKDSEGRVLLGRRHQPEIPEIHGKWNLLGGKIELGETPEQAVVREIKEESGLDIEVVKTLPQTFTRVVRKIDGSQMRVEPITYECVISGGSIGEAQPDPGVSELRFFAPNEIELHTINPHDYKIIEFRS